MMGIMMSEDIHKWSDGRYTLMFDEHTFFVWDNVKEKRMTALDVTKKLNEQQATIEMYQRRVDKREEQISIIKKHCLKFLTDEQFKIIRKELENE